MTWNELALKLTEMLLPLIAALIAAAIGYGAAYLRKKVAAIEHEMARRTLEAALTEAEIVAQDAVRATNQVLVDDLRDKSADGKLTRDEAREAMRTAQGYFLAHITGGSKQVLEAALGPVHEWLEGFIEARLAAEKAPGVKAEVLRIASPLS